MTPCPNFCLSRRVLAKFYPAILLVDWLEHQLMYMYIAWYGILLHNNFPHSVFHWLKVPLEHDSFLKTLYTKCTECSFKNIIHLMGDVKCHCNMPHILVDAHKCHPLCHALKQNCFLLMSKSPSRQDPGTSFERFKYFEFFLHSPCRHFRRWHDGNYKHLTKMSCWWSYSESILSCLLSSVVMMAIRLLT